MGQQTRTNWQSNMKSETSSKVGAKRVRFSDIVSMILFLAIALSCAIVEGKPAWIDLLAWIGIMNVFIASILDRREGSGVKHLSPEGK